MQIAHRKIGPDQPPVVIADIGINHGGDLDTARQMVTLAARAGAEIAKHQTHFAWDEMTEEAKSILPPNAGGRSEYPVDVERSCLRCCAAHARVAVPGVSPPDPQSISEKKKP